MDDIRTAPLNLVDLAMVDAFLDAKHEESIWCDYKSAPGHSLVKCVAAMANTQGGIVFVGVTEADGTPTARPGVEGAPNTLTSRIENMLYDSIRPTVHVEVHSVDLGGGTCVAVVRVPASLAAPHALRDGGIYIRVSQHSRPVTEDAAPLGWIEFLFERRREPERFRRQLDDEANVLLTQAQRDAYPDGSIPPTISFRACAPYPSARLSPERKLRDLVDPVIEHRSVPYAGGAFLRRQWFNDLTKRNQFSLFRAHVAGHVFIGEPIFLIEQSPGSGILPGFIRGHVTQAWTRAHAVLWLIGYRGLVSARLDFAQAAGLKFIRASDDPSEPSESIVSDVHSETQALLVEEALRPETAVPVLREMFLEVMWGLGYPHPEVDDSVVRKAFEEAMTRLTQRSGELRRAFGAAG
jgi:Putative DNA-binding domain